MMYPAHRTASLRMERQLRRLQVLAAIGLSVTGVCTAADRVTHPARPTPEVVLTLKPHAVERSSSTASTLVWF